MAAPKSIAVPEDAEDLMALAKLKYPDATGFRFASDCVVCQHTDPDSGVRRSLHMTYRSLRKHAKAKALEAAGASAAEIAAATSRLAESELNRTDKRRK